MGTPYRVVAPASDSVSVHWVSPLRVVHEVEVAHLVVVGGADAGLAVAVALLELELGKLHWNFCFGMLWNKIAVYLQHAGLLRH